MHRKKQAETKRAKRAKHATAQCGPKRFVTYEKLADKCVRGLCVCVPCGGEGDRYERMRMDSMPGGEHGLICVSSWVGGGDALGACLPSLDFPCLRFQTNTGGAEYRQFKRRVVVDAEAAGGVGTRDEGRHHSRGCV